MRGRAGPTPISSSQTNSWRAITLRAPAEPREETLTAHGLDRKVRFGLITESLAPLFAALYAFAALGAGFK
jgi:hypothetical protein